VSDRYKPRFGFPIADWYRWFAWRPVNTLDRGWVWLRTVNRRRCQVNPWVEVGTDFWFQHAIDISEDRRPRS